MLALALAACSSEESGGSSGGASGQGGQAGASGAAGVDSGPPAPYSVSAFDAVRIGSDPNGPNFQAAEVEVDFGAGPFASVRLIVSLGTTCFPFESWESNPPPDGHNWPADCDAFDRNFEFVLDPPADAGGKPGLELVRAITPFGGPLELDVDVTDVANGLPGKHRLQTKIGTWSDASGQVTGANGGWNVTARFDVVPGAAPRHVLAVEPLFDDSMTTAAGPAIPIQVPEGTTSSRLEYRVTGHGGVAFGCGTGTAEEFCLRTHTLFVDDAFAADAMPWRNDCASLCTIAHQGPSGGGFDYCAENPCGAIASVQASRANWCPGSITPPFEWDFDALRTPGAHEIRWQISEVADGGSWRVSATYFAFGGP
jgi:hypothetical protein